MPQRGWEIGGRRVSFAELRESRDLFLDGWPVPLLLALGREREEDWRILHPSELGRCLRQRVLLHQVDYFARPDPAWAPLLGTGIHQLLAEQARTLYPPAECLVEERLEWAFQVEGETFRLSGQIDLYHRPSRTLVDYKTTKRLREGVDWGYEVQQNLYAHLLRQQGEAPERSLLWFVETQTRRKKGQAGEHLQFQTVEVPLWKAAEVEEVLRHLAAVLVRAHRDGVLPRALAYSDEGSWQCWYCPVWQRCRELERQGQ